MEPTRDQLQAEVLEILYQKSLNRPTWVSCPEVLEYQKHEGFRKKRQRGSGLACQE